MENVMVDEFLKISGRGGGYGSGYGYSSCCGYGDGDGDGDGYGYGDGSGYGYSSCCGYGDGDGYGDSYGYGDGYGDGYGSGDGDGSGYGDGDGSGDGSGVKSIDGLAVYKIDGVQTGLTHIKGSVATGFILNTDLTTSKCVVVKRGNLFAHGETLRAAVSAMEEKMFEDMPTVERIDAFLEHFADKEKKYTAMEFFDWHNKLTGSCEMGRKSFARNHGIDLEADTFTVTEFVEITKDDYGREIIRELEKRLEK